jgi:hypothetical protein
VQGARSRRQQRQLIVEVGALEDNGELLRVGPAYGQCAFRVSEPLGVRLTASRPAGDHDAAPLIKRGDPSRRAPQLTVFTPGEVDAEEAHALGRAAR